MAVAAADKALADAGITADADRLRHRRHRHPPAADPVGRRASSAHRLGATNAAALRHLRRVRRLLPRRRARPTTWSRGGSAEHVLVVGVEKLTDIVDPTTAAPRSSSATAPARSSSARPTSPASARSCGAPTAARPTRSPRTRPGTRCATTPTHKFPTLRWRASRSSAGPSSRWRRSRQQALDAAGVTADDLDAFIPHQANLRIIDAMVKALGLPERVAVARDIVDTGNTSAASIPLAMERMLEQRRGAAAAALALLIGFGAGLAYAAQVVVAAVTGARRPDPGSPRAAAPQPGGRADPTRRSAAAWPPSRRSSPASPRS